MLIVIGVVALIAIIVGIVGDHNTGTIGWFVLMACGILLLLGTIIGLICVGFNYQECTLIDNKIVITEEANAEIETTLKLTVEQYQKYEKETYKELKIEDIVAAINVYPELKSDTMVNNLMETYRANKQEIKKLKIEKLNEKIYKWWLYFG